MATLNSGAILEKCLRSIRRQKYDQSKIEIVVADGGSTDGTIEVIKNMEEKSFLKTLAVRKRPRQLL